MTHTHTQKRKLYKDNFFFSSNGSIISPCGTISRKLKHYLQYLVKISPLKIQQYSPYTLSQMILNKCKKYILTKIIKQKS